MSGLRMAFEEVGRLQTEEVETAGGVLCQTPVVFRCTTCFALVVRDDIGSHDLWHDRLEQRP